MQVICLGKPEKAFNLHLSKATSIALPQTTKPTPHTTIIAITEPLIPLPLPQHIPKLLKRTPVQLGILPQIRRQEAIRIAHGDKGRFERVLERFGAAGRGGVDVLDAGELEEAFYGGGGDEAGAAGCGDELEVWWLVHRLVW